MAAAAAAAWLGAYAVWLALAPGGEHAKLVFSDTAYLAPIVLATLASVLAARSGSGHGRVFWGLVAASNACWLGGEIGWSVRELTVGAVPFPWWTDVGFIPWYVLMGVAICFAYRPSLRTVRLDGVLDGLIVVATLTVFWWWFVLRDVVVGLAVWEPELDADDLLRHSQALLAAARRLGRNHVRGPAPDQLLTSAELTDDVTRQLLELVGVVDRREGVEAGHSQTVAHLARRVAVKLELPSEIVARHTMNGARLVRRIPAVSHVAYVVQALHEHVAGGGHPSGVEGSEIPAAARVVAVAERLVSMTADRPHRAATGLTSALSEIWRFAGERYDPLVVSALFALVQEGDVQLRPRAPGGQPMLEVYGAAV